MSQGVEVRRACAATHPQPFLTCGFESGSITLALCTQGVCPPETETAAVSGKSVIVWNGLILGTAPVFLSVVPILLATGTNTGFGLAERAAVFLQGTIIVGCLAILVHSQPGRADRITGRKRFRGFRAAWIEGDKCLAARRGQLIERQAGDTVHRHMAFVSPVELVPAFIGFRVVLPGVRHDRSRLQANEGGVHDPQFVQLPYQIRHNRP